MRLINQINLFSTSRKFRIKKCTTKEKENQIAITDAVNKAPKAIEIISSINTNKISPIENKISLNLVLKLLRADTIPYEGKI